MIELSQSTTSLIESIDTHSGNALIYKKDFGLLLELAIQHQLMPDLHQLGFLAKFIYKAVGILKRAGNTEKDTQMLAKEFQESIGKTKKLMKNFLSFAPSDVQSAFTQKFLDLTPEAFDRLLVLCKDLSWYKNYEIDTRRR